MSDEKDNVAFMNRAELRECIRIGIGDAIHQELGPLLELHARRMLFASLLGKLDSCPDEPTSKRVVANMTALVDAIIEESR